MGSPKEVQLVLEVDDAFIKAVKACNFKSIQADNIYAVWRHEIRNW
jgi:hypothetical protein